MIEESNLFLNEAGLEKAKDIKARYEGKKLGFFIGRRVL